MSEIRIRPMSWLPRISMGLTIAQLSERLRCAECGGPLLSVKPWRAGGCAREAARATGLGLFPPLANRLPAIFLSRDSAAHRGELFVREAHLASSLAGYRNEARHGSRGNGTGDRLAVYWDRIGIDEARLGARRDLAR
jgi:hypothetical protein